MSETSSAGYGDDLPERVVSFKRVRKLMEDLFALIPPEERGALATRKKYAKHFLKLFPEDFYAVVPESEPQEAVYAVTTPPKPWG